MTEQQRNNLAKMETQGWEAADWKARALESTQKLAAANAQVHMYQVSNLTLVACRTWWQLQYYGVPRP